MPALSVWCIRAALAYLGLGFTIGAWMLAGRGWGAATNGWLWAHSCC